MLTDWEGHKIRNWIALVTGVFLLAISVNWVYDPAGMVTGGVTGLGISIKYLSGKFSSKNNSFSILRFLM